MRAKTESSAQQQYSRNQPPAPPRRRKCLAIDSAAADLLNPNTKIQTKLGSIDKESKAIAITEIKHKTAQSTNIK